MEAISMSTFIKRVVPAWLLVLVTAPVFAQTTQTLSMEPANPPRWDAAGGFGLLARRHADDPYSYGWWDQTGEVRFDAGRYWTTHLKTEIGVSLPQTWNDRICSPIPGAGFPAGFACSAIDHRLTLISPAVTYQFLENTFAHPFVSTGVRFGIQETQIHRPEDIRALNRAGPGVPEVERRMTTIHARPFVAGGFKSYFNDRTFVRSEALVAFDSSRAHQMAFRLGFGIDF
jgi:hypothetical protein